MSLTNPNTPISQQDLQDFYHKLLPYMGGGSGASSVSELTDVDLDNVQNGQVLKWNSTDEAWENANESGGGASSVSDLTDVTLTNLQDNQHLEWDEENEKWINKSGSFTPKSAEYEYLSYSNDLIVNGTYTQIDAHAVQYKCTPTGGYEGLSIKLEGLQTGIIYFLKVDVEIASGAGRASQSYAWKLGYKNAKLTNFNVDKAILENEAPLPINLGDKITYQFEITAGDYNTLNFYTSDAQNTVIFNITDIRAGAVGNGYIPVQVTQIQTVGTKIATIEVDGDSTDLYAPNSGGSGGSATILAETLTAGSSTVTFTGVPTTGDILVDFFTSTGINYTAINTAVAGHITLTFAEQLSDVTVYCKIEEVTV